MKDFKRISPNDFKSNTFDLIGKKWALLTAQSKNNVGTMTVSWGGTGVLWNKPVAFIFVRPQRNTRKLIDLSDSFSLNFFTEGYRDALTFCGKNSGKDVDKFKECGFTLIDKDENSYIAQANIVILCKKIYKQQFSPDCIIANEIANNYPDKDYHFMYVGEIIDILQK